MPNWCANSLEVTAAAAGDVDGAAQLAAFRGVLLGSEKPEGMGMGGMVLDLGCIVPMPPGLPRAFQPGSGTGQERVAWCNANWGCHSALFEPKISEDSAAALRLTADTKWTPPTVWVVAASAHYPRLRFELTYSEQGNDEPLDGRWGAAWVLSVRHDANHITLPTHQLAGQTRSWVSIYHLARHTPSGIFVERAAPDGNFSYFYLSLEQIKKNGITAPQPLSSMLPLELAAAPAASEDIGMDISSGEEQGGGGEDETLENRWVRICCCGG
jgi:hypothetical protein